MKNYLFFLSLVSVPQGYGMHNFKKMVPFARKICSKKKIYSTYTVKKQLQDKIDLLQRHESCLEKEIERLKRVEAESLLKVNGDFITYENTVNWVTFSDFPEIAKSKIIECPIFAQKLLDGYLYLLEKNRFKQVDNCLNLKHFYCFLPSLVLCFERNEQGANKAQVLTWMVNLFLKKGIDFPDLIQQLDRSEYWSPAWSVLTLFHSKCTYQRDLTKLTYKQQEFLNQVKEKIRS